MSFFQKLFKPYSPQTRSEVLYKLSISGKMDALLEAIEDDSHDRSKGFGKSKNQQITVRRVGAIAKDK